MNSDLVEGHGVRLTNREYDVLRLVADEFSNREIASRLSITVGTVESHRKNLFLKLRAKNMAGLIKRAFDNRILFPKE
jgi:DNA-binding CsgD family transcriptional regulator